MIEKENNINDTRSIVFNDAQIDEDFELIVNSSKDIEDVDFSYLFADGSFRKAFSNAKKKVQSVKKQKAETKKVLGKKISVKQGAKINAGKKQGALSNILIPRDKTIIVENVDKFVTSGQMEWFKDISRYKGEKLKELLLIIDNTNSDVDLTVDLFDPSSRMDWLFSNTQDLNGVIQVAGGVVRYSDILFNLLANPMMIVNAKFIIEGSSIEEQLYENLFIKNKTIEGWQKINPVSVAMRVDTMQREKYVVGFNFMENLNRPFVPDGMDVAGYTVKAGNSVTMCFFVKQHVLKKMLFEEVEKSKLILT